jgi:N-glycosylase/DNA lyase
MTQNLFARHEGHMQCLQLPEPTEDVITGVTWGLLEQIFTPAYWRSQVWLRQLETPATHRLGETLEEECAACLLGGHGIPSEVGIAAFKQLKDEGLLQGKPASEATLFAALSVPLNINNRQIRYRFARQKAQYLHYTLVRLAHEHPTTKNHLQFRNWLLDCPGIGFKTASWVTRNWLNSDSVAIIDIHIWRAGLLIGLYDASLNPTRHYLEMENRFLHLAAGLEVRASLLDALIWAEMKEAHRLALQLLNPTSNVGIRHKRQAPLFVANA